MRAGKAAVVGGQAQGLETHDDVALDLGDARKRFDSIERKGDLSRSHVGKPTKDLLRVFACASFFAKTGRPLFAGDA